MLATCSKGLWLDNDSDSHCYEESNVRSHFTAIARAWAITLVTVWPTATHLLVQPRILVPLFFYAHNKYNYYLAVVERQGLAVKPRLVGALFASAFEMLISDMKQPSAITSCTEPLATTVFLMFYVVAVKL